MRRSYLFAVVILCLAGFMVGGTTIPAQAQGTLGYISYELTCGTFASRITNTPFASISVQVSVNQRTYRSGDIRTHTGNASSTVYFAPQSPGSPIQITVSGNNNQLIMYQVLTCAGNQGGGIPPSISEAQQRGVPGGIDLIFPTRAWGYADIKNYTGKWNGWVMFGNGKPSRSLDGMPAFDQICQQVFGGNYRATRVGDGANDVRCYLPGTVIAGTYDSGNTGGGNQGGNPGGNPGGSGNGNYPGFNCPGKPAPRLHPGDSGRVTRGEPLMLRARFESGEYLAIYPAGTTFQILDGPYCGVYNVWWHVRVTNGLTGWFPEGRADQGYWLEPLAARGVPGRTGGSNYAWDGTVFLPGYSYRIERPYVYLPDGIYDLKLRSGPGTGYGIIGTLVEHNYYRLLQVSGSWVQLLTPGGQIGWAASSYTVVYP